MPKPAYNERIQWSPNCHPRNVRNALFGTGHTQEGSGTAASLANYLCNPNSKVSYHNAIDNNRNVVAVVDTDDASWSVGNANDVTWNYCYAGSFASWSRQQWLDNMSNAIEIHAYLWVLDAKKYGRNPYPVSWDEIRAGKSGATDHQGINEAYLRVKGHTDLGPQYPWDVFHGHVDRFVKEGTDDVRVPTLTDIEIERAANEWLGAKIIAERELPTPDGRGQYAHYEHGSIYWTETTKAHAIPAIIYSTYEQTGWETGLLGYPTGLALQLVAHTRSSGMTVAGGWVQAFEGGTVYRADGSDAGYIVQGTIREYYKSTNYENGDLGWPKTNEQDWIRNGDVVGKIQDYEHGTVYWLAATNTALGVSHQGYPIFPLGDAAPATAQPGYRPSLDEVSLTPRDGMRGGISHFANADDASTRGRTMGISGEPADRPWDQWFCAMRFGYVGTITNPANPAWLKPADNIGLTTTEKMRLKGVLPTRRLLVTNPSTGKRVVVRPADWGPGVPSRVVDVSATAMAALGAQTDTQVSVEWCDPSRPLGPVQ